MKLKLLFIIILSIGFVWKSNAQVRYQVYAEYLYFFANNTEYDDEKSDGDFVIGVIGPQSLVESVQGIAFKKKVGLRNITVKKFEDPEHAEDCHILFLCTTKLKELEVASEFSDKKHVLLVTEHPSEMHSGETINFVQKEDGIQFELYANSAKKQHVKINDDIIRIAILKD